MAQAGKLCANSACNQKVSSARRLQIPAFFRRRLYTRVKPTRCGGYFLGRMLAFARGWLLPWEEVGTGDVYVFESEDDDVGGGGRGRIVRGTAIQTRKLPNIFNIS